MLTIRPNLTKDVYQVSKYWKLLCSSHLAHSDDQLKYISGSSSSVLRQNVTADTTILQLKVSCSTPRLYRRHFSVAVLPIAPI